MPGKITQPGTYTAQVVSTALGESKSSRSPQVVVEFEDQATGDRIVAYLSCKDNAWQYTEQALRTMGWDAAARGYQFEELNEEPSPIAGSTVDIVVEMETYNGRTDPRVRWINEVGSAPGMRRMESSEAATFAERLRKQLGVSTPAGARRLPRQQPQRSQQDADDNIPF